MGQHMAYAALTDDPVPPMPARISAWSVYRLFETRDDQHVFVGIISEKHWEKFCQAFERNDWLKDDRLRTNNDRISEREWFLPEVEEMLKQYTKQEIIERCDKAGICFAPITRPDDLFEDPQLNNQQAGLLKTTFPSGVKTKMPRLPIQIDDYNFDLRMDPPPIGSHSKEVLSSLGYSEGEIQAFIDKGVVNQSEG
jgi:crotonobetainyl-CoA:carnitine CoA-transferase CaiB-like acyl-CoA transferase